jgi:hypothetical protein
VPRYVATATRNQRALVRTFHVANNSGIYSVTSLTPTTIQYTDQDIIELLGQTFSSAALAAVAARQLFTNAIQV